MLEWRAEGAARYVYTLESEIQARPLSGVLPHFPLPSPSAAASAVSKRSTVDLSPTFVTFASVNITMRFATCDFVFCVSLWMSETPPLSHHRPEGSVPGAVLWARWSARLSGWLLFFLQV